MDPQSASGQERGHGNGPQNHYNKLVQNRVFPGPGYSRIYALSKNALTLKDKDFLFIQAMELLRYRTAFGMTGYLKYTPVKLFNKFIFNLQGPFTLQVGQQFIQSVSGSF